MVIDADLWKKLLSFLIPDELQASFNEQRLNRLREAFAAFQDFPRNGIGKTVILEKIAQQLSFVQFGKETHNSFNQDSQLGDYIQYCCDYLRNLKIPEKGPLPRPALIRTLVAERQLLARRLTTFAELNEANPQGDLFLGRLTSLTNCTSPDVLAEQIFRILETRTRVVWTFDSSFAPSATEKTQILTRYNKPGNQDVEYKRQRETTEKAFVRAFPNELSKPLLANKNLKPRFAVLMIFGTPKPVERYGKNFVVFKEKLSFAATFSPRNSLGQHLVKLITYGNWPLLLSQAPEILLKSLIDYAKQGTLPANYDYATLETYIEAQIPGVPLLDPDLVEHVHFAADYPLSAALEQILKDQQISYSKGENPYPAWKAQILDAAALGKASSFTTLAREHPVLLKMANSLGQDPFLLTIIHCHSDLALSVLPLVTSFGQDIHGYMAHHYAAAGNYDELTIKIVQRLSDRDFIAKTNKNGTIFDIVSEAANLSLFLKLLELKPAYHSQYSAFAALLPFPELISWLAKKQDCFSKIEKLKAEQVAILAINPEIREKWYRGGVEVFSTLACNDPFPNHKKKNYLLELHAQGFLSAELLEVASPLDLQWLVLKQVRRSFMTRPDKYQFLAGLSREVITMIMKGFSRSNPSVGTMLSRLQPGHSQLDPRAVGGLFAEEGTYEPARFFLALLNGNLGKGEICSMVFRGFLKLLLLQITIPASIRESLVKMEEDWPLCNQQNFGKKMSVIYNLFHSQSAQSAAYILDDALHSVCHFLSCFKHKRTPPGLSFHLAYAVKKQRPTVSSIHATVRREVQLYLETMPSTILNIKPSAITSRVNVKAPAAKRYLAEPLVDAKLADFFVQHQYSRFWYKIFMLHFTVDVRYLDRDSETGRELLAVSQFGFNVSGTLPEFHFADLLHYVVRLDGKPVDRVLFTKDPEVVYPTNTELWNDTKSLRGLSSEKYRLNTQALKADLKVQFNFLLYVLNREGISVPHLSVFDYQYLGRAFALDYQQTIAEAYAEVLSADQYSFEAFVFSGLSAQDLGIFQTAFAPYAVVGTPVLFVEYDSFLVAQWLLKKYSTTLHHTRRLDEIVAAQRTIPCSMEEDSSVKSAATFIRTVANKVPGGSDYRDRLRMAMGWEKRKKAEDGIKPAF